MTDAAWSADQTLAERARVKTILNRQARAGALEFARRDRIQVDKQVVQTTTAGKPRVVGRVEIRA